MSKESAKVSFLRSTAEMRELGPIIKDALSHFQAEIQKHSIALAQAEQAGSDDDYQSAAYDILQSALGRDIVERFSGHPDFVYFYVEVSRMNPVSNKTDELVAGAFSSPREAFDEVREEHGSILPTDKIAVELYVSDTSVYEESYPLPKDRWSPFLKTLPRF